MPSSSPPDPVLLAEWLDQRSERAFHDLVARYAGLVHAAAQRTSGDGAMAADAAQATFILLARKAKSLTTRASLAGWLHQTAILQTRNLLRQARRETRKRQALEVAMENQAPTRDDTWQDIQPLLDDALAALSDRDREALLLRFYRALSVKEVAATLGIGTDAAQKRIDRATQRLRGHFARWGLSTGSTFSGAMLAGFAADTQAAAPAVSLLASKAIAASTAATVTSTTSILTAAAMKTTSAFVPIVVLLAAGIWIASQFRSIAELQDQNAQMQKSLVTAGILSKTQSRPTVTATALDGRPINWAEVARQLETAQKEMGGYLKSTARLDAQFIAMTRDELLAAIDEIEAAELSNEARELLEKRIFSELAGPKGGPKLAMDRFVNRYNRGGWEWTFGACFTRWMDKEPDQAIAWLQQHAKDLESPDTLICQSFYSRLVPDPATASRILTALPEEKRLLSLGRLGLGDLPADQQVAWMKIVRAQVPEKDHVKAATWLTMNWSDGDGSRMRMAEVCAYLDRIEATPAEREACILLAVKEGASMGETRRDDSLPPAERIEVLRACLAAQTPHLMDSLTGKGFVSCLGRGGASYAEVAELALSYYEANPNDELLIPLLERKTDDQSKPAARLMAERLSDETLRRKYLEKHQ